MPLRSRQTKPVGSTSRNVSPRRSRAASPDAPLADDLDARCRDLEACLRVSQVANESLTERADLLLGRVVEAIEQCEDPAMILGTVLEQVSIITNISYCAFVEPLGVDLVIRHEYAAFSDGGPTGARLQVPADEFEALVGAEHGSREWFLPPEALSIPGGVLAPSSVMLMSSSPDNAPPLLFLAADQRRTATQMAALLPVLWRVIGMARARIENLKLMQLLADLSAEFGQRAGARTADLDHANDSLRVEVAERERAEHGLRLAGVAVENIAEGVLITDPKLRILTVNRAFSEITGYGAAEVVGQQPNLLQSGRHDQAFFEVMWASILDSGRWQGEIWNRRKDGTIYPELLSISAVRDDQGRLTNYVGVFSDISAIKASEERFEFLAQHDPLTGLPNRLLFAARGERVLEQARFSGGRVAVMFLDLDLDRFKHLSDTLDHPAGDELLRKVAERLDFCVRADDIVGRLGGDEFMVLLKELSDSTSAGAIARRMLNTLAAPFSLGGNELFVTACIGVSVCPEDGNDLTALMDQAASAMYRAKKQGRGNLQFYTAELTSTAVERFRLESDLRQALAREEFVLHFQPQVSVRTGRIVGAEALLRWRHPELGLVFPGQFIPLAEDTGLVAGIGAWVMRAACRQVRQWMADGLPALRVAVNVSAREISGSLLTERIAATLAETGLEPGLLEIEITESSVMANLEAAVGALKAVKTLGVTLALDDFGTGYSSLNYLRRFPIDRLKLDGSFIRQIADDETDQAIARAAVELGHGLKLAVVAEGVETQAQLDVLRANGCDDYQGHLFAAALPPAELAALLRGASR